MLYIQDTACGAVLEHLGFVNPCAPFGRTRDVQCAWGRRLGQLFAHAVRLNSQGRHCTVLNIQMALRSGSGNGVLQGDCALLTLKQSEMLLEG